MTKKILLGLFILLMCAVSFIAYNFYKNVKEPVSKIAFDAIPQNAALIIKENDFSKLYQKIKSTNIIWQELTDSTDAAIKINNQLNYFDSLLNITFKNDIKNKAVLSSLHLSGAKDYNFVFYLSLPADYAEEQIIQKIKNTTKSNPSKRDYDGVNIYSFPINKQKLSLVTHKNTLAFSYSTVLMEDVIRQLNNESSLLTDKDFAKVIETSGQSEDGNIFINNKYFSKVINQYLNKDSREYAQSFENYAGWTELDLTIKPNSIAFNGFSFAKDGSSINIMKNQKPQDIDMLEVIPYNAAYIYHYGISDIDLFMDNRKGLLKGKNQFFNYQKYIDEQTDKYGIDLEVELLKNIKSEIAFVITESQTEDFSHNKFVIYKTDDIDKTKADLMSLVNKTNTDGDSSSFNGFEINRIALKNLFPKLIGKPFINLDNHFFTTINDYVVFGNTVSGLKSFLTDVNNKKILANDENFESFSDNLSSSSNIFMYSNIARSVNLYKTISKEDYLSVFDEKLTTFRKFEAVTFQMTTEKNNLYYNNIYLKYNPVYKQETASLWELALDTFTSNSPEIITNHKTGGKEIIVQDDANKLYLISNTGKVIWTKQLQESVMSKFHQIDVYKNNKLQLLFNTKSKIYLLDRNGNNVESYPVKLPAEATNSVTPLDYEKSRNYRIIIGCYDNMVYNYDITGAKVKGWEYSSTQSPAKGEVWHFAISGKDYIVVPLQNGQVKVIERSGKDRIKLENMLPIGNPIYLKVSSSLAKTYLLSADTSGTVVKLYFNDKKEAVKIDNVSSGSKFCALDYNGDNILDYAFYSDVNLSIYNSDKNELYKEEYQSKITAEPHNFKMEENALGIVSGNQVYLIKNGILSDGFPLAGSTSFHIADINKDNTYNLVVAQQNMIYTYNLK